MIGLTRFAFSTAIVLAATVDFASAAKEQVNNSSGSSKATKYVAGTTVDFSAALDLSFASLTTLGSRIEQCRIIAPDPMGLAAAAKELAVAEKVSGKKASLSSGELMREAIHIAKVRFSSRELKGLLYYVKDEDLRDELETIAQKAERDEKERSEKARLGVRARATTVNLFVHNDSLQTVRVYYNRRYVGRLKPKGHGQFQFENHGPYQELAAYGSRGRRWHRQRDGNANSYSWTIHAHR